jgi:Tol biopolymer transport system component
MAPTAASVDDGTAPRSRWRSLTLFVLLAGVTVQVVAATDTHARDAAAEGRSRQTIAFVRSHFRDELTLKSIWPDGTHARRIAKRGICGTWSPDGRKFAHATNSGSIVIKHPNDGRKRRVETERRVFDVTDWSPNGKRLLFEAERKGLYDIFSIRKDGENVKRVTNNQFEDHDASWSPDGKHIAFVFAKRDDGAASHLGVVRTDGTRFRRLTTGSSDWAESPTWAGHKIVYANSERDYTRGEAIFSIHRNGTRRRRLNAINGPQSLDSSGPSGEIVFSTVYRGGGIFTMDRNGTDLHSVAPGRRNSCPNWRARP